MNQKTKRILLIVILILSLVGVGVCVGWSVGKAERAETTGEELESLRDTIKVHKTEATDADPTPVESPDIGDTNPSETEPDSEEIKPEEIKPAVTETPEETEGQPENTPDVETDNPVTVPEASESLPPETLPVSTETKPVTEAATETMTPPVTETEQESEGATESETEAVTESKETETETAKPAVPAEPTLDFEHLQTEVNPDIHAWIEIANTKVDYPILQSPDDDEKYLDVAYDGSGYVGGALFTQATYNGTDFNDRVTFIYGHTMANHTAFGQLYTIYSDPAKFEENNEIKLYLPEEVRYYTIFAAVPYEAYHIPHAYDFSVDYWYKTFFENVGKIRALDANFDEASFPAVGDRVIVLSTCYYGDTGKRYLVMAVNQSDLAAHAVGED